MSLRLFYILLTFAAVECGEGVWAQEEGLASHYHHRFHNRKSSSRGVHDKEELVAAHRAYPFDTFLGIMSLENMKGTIMCVTSHESHYRKRIIGVSASAVEALDFIDKSVAKVRVEVAPDPLDLRYLSLIYLKTPCLDIDYLRSDSSYEVKSTE